MVKVLEHIGKQRAKPPCCCCGMLHPGKYAKLGCAQRAKQLKTQPTHNQLTHERVRRAYLVDKVLLPVKVFAFMAPLLSIIGELFDQ